MIAFIKKSVLYSVLSAFLKNKVYTSRTGLITGLKRRGGFGFLPFKKATTREQMFLKSLDFERKIIYDVGGYIGLVTMFFAREAKENGCVVTFEPNPQNYSAIMDHLQLNGFTNVKVLQKGLGDKREILKFLVGDPARGTASTEKQQEYIDQKDIKFIEIEVDTMDNQIAVNNLPKPDFIKIDVEGLEIKVLRGMEQTIQKYKPEIFVELHGIREQEIVEFFLNHNYKIYQVEDGFNITRQNIESVYGHIYATPKIS